MLKFIPALFLVVTLVHPIISSAQMSTSTNPQLLTIEDAIRAGLDRNFGIVIARNEAEIASLNRNWGAAGFTPDLNLSAGVSGGRDDVTITENGDTRPNERTLISSSNLDASLSWTIFDGLKMFTTYNKLVEFENLGNIRARIQIENTVSDIISAYYNIIRIEKRLTVLQNTVELSQERFRIADTKRQIGSGSEYEFLLAQADLNSDKTAVIREEVLLNDAKIRLLTLLNMDPTTPFAVTSEINLADIINFDMVFEGMNTSNSQLMAAGIQHRIATLERQEVLRGRMPRVSLNAGYNINNRETDNVVVRMTETEGLRYGVTVSVPIFDGFNMNRKLQAAKIYERNADLQLQDMNSRLYGLAVAEYQNYVSSREVVRIEQENLELVIQTVEIAMERFYQGTISSLELRETQRNLINTETRLITAQYEAKISETELMRLMGRLTIY